MPKPRAIVYVDGFNLYCGALLHTNRKWLDLQALFVRLRNNDDIQVIRYFTALPHHNPAKVARHQVYLEALATFPLVQVYQGKFKKKGTRCTVRACTFQGKREFKVREEKRTDVNIAVQMVVDAALGRCDTQVLVSGDSDIVPAIEVIRANFPTVRVVVYVPALSKHRAVASELRKVAHASDTLPNLLIQRSQLPNPIITPANKVITKPTSW